MSNDPSAALALPAAGPEPKRAEGVKVVLGDDIRKLRVPAHYRELVNKVATLYDIPVKTSTIVLKYCDVEGDNVTIACDQDLEEALEQCSKPTLRITASVTTLDGAATPPQQPEHHQQQHQQQHQRQTRRDGPPQQGARGSDSANDGNRRQGCHGSGFRPINVLLHHGNQLLHHGHRMAEAAYTRSGAGPAGGDLPPPVEAIFEHGRAILRQGEEFAEAFSAAQNARREHRNREHGPNHHRCHRHYHGGQWRDNSWNFPGGAPGRAAAPGAAAGTDFADEAAADGHGEGAAPVGDLPRGDGKPRKLLARFVSHETIQEGETIRPGQSFEKRWLVRNDGVTAWPLGSNLVFVSGRSGDSFGVPEEVPMNMVLQPGEQGTVCVSAVAPERVGYYEGFFRLQGPKGRKFGQRLKLAATVMEASAPPSGDAKTSAFEDHVDTDTTKVDKATSDTDAGMNDGFVDVGCGTDGETRMPNKEHD